MGSINENTNSNNILTNAEMLAVWEFMEANYSRSLFREINMAIDNEEIDFAENVAAVHVIQSKFADISQKITELNINDNYKLPAVRELANKYIEQYVLGFALIKDAPSRDLIGQMVASYVTYNAHQVDSRVSPVQEEELEEVAVQLTSEEKKSIFRKMHEEVLPSLLLAMSQKLSGGQLITSFNDLYEICDALKYDYDSLISFDIQNKKEKKDLIKANIRQYINILIFGSKLTREENITTLINKAKNAFGVTQFEKLIKQMENHSSFPTPLELEAADDDLRQNIRALDLYLHLPKNILDRVAFARTVTFRIQDGIKNIHMNSSNNNNNPSPSTAAPSFQGQKPTPKPANQNSRPYAPFGNAFNTFTSQINDEAAQAKIYKEKAYLHKQEVINANKFSNCNLFQQIVTGVNVKTIEQTLNFLSNAKSFKDQFGNTALHLAALCGREDVVDCLLYYNFDSNLKNEEGNLPLHLSLLGGNAGVVKSLVTTTKDINVKNKDGLDLFMFSMKVCEKNSELPVLLLKSPSFQPFKRH